LQSNFYFMNLKRLVFLLLITISAIPAFSQAVEFAWNADTESLLRKELATAFANWKLPDKDKQALTECVLTKLKQKFPDGVKTDRDAFFAINKEIGRECAEAINYAGVPFWSETSEVGFKNSFAAKLPSIVKPEIKTKLTDCITAELKIKFPEGFSINDANRQEMDSLMEVLTDDCCAKIGYGGFFTWSDATDAALKTSFTNIVPADASVNQKTAFADCMLDKLKTTYPDGISFGIGEKEAYTEYVKKITNECLKEHFPQKKPASPPVAKKKKGSIRHE
jgi:hypothetical protein